MSPLITALLTQLPTFVKIFEKIAGSMRKTKKEEEKVINFRKRPTLMALVGLTLSMLIGQSAHAVTFAWDANTETDLAGYRLYQAMVPSGPYVMVREFAAPAISGTQTLTADGIYYYVLTAFDTLGNESGYSNEVSYAETSFPPATPKALRVSP